MIETIQLAIHGTTILLSFLAFLFSLLIAKNYSNGKINKIWKILSITLFILFIHYTASAATLFYELEILTTTVLGTELLFILLFTIALYRHLRTLNSI
ncbi:MAG: hypothetical protein KAS30_03175 [Candidatus Diapherotrites archaeon]|nr:hypothetical protein [Candidatus Diapherotrites archaeon]